MKYSYFNRCHIDQIEESMKSWYDNIYEYEKGESNGFGQVFQDSYSFWKNEYRKPMEDALRSVLK